MTVSVRRLCLAVTLSAGFAFATAHAQSTPNAPLTADQSKQLDAYMKQLGRPRPLDDKTAAAMPAPHAAASSLASNLLTAETASGVHGDSLPAVAGKDSRKTIDAFVALSEPPSIPAGITFGLATGQGVQPALPALAQWDKEAGQAIVAAFQKPGQNSVTADQAATFAAATAAPVDPATQERLDLVHTLFRLDGTEDLIRQFVATEHMKLIIAEVARHIDFTKLSETDKYRLAAIAAVAQTELEDRIIDLNAQVQAAGLSKPEIMQLIVAFDIDAQRKQTQMRLNDDGKIDRAAELDLRLAQYQIVKQFEAGQ